jgi:hypothetical protein
MVQCPVLGAVPSPYAAIDSDLVIKASHTGITFLQQRRYKKRYTGSKQCAVDINGKLFLNAKDLERKLKEAKPPDRVRAKKKEGCPPAFKSCLEIFKPFDPVVAAISDVISEPAKKPRKKSYSVNKREVRARLLGYINTQRGKKELYFWSISFPANTPDSICYQAFNTWLTALRQYKMLKDYLWVAERQTGDRITDGRAPTNTIHFHMAVPHYMNVQRANAMMRGTLKTFAKRGEIPYHHRNPQIGKYNGVDLCKNRNTKRVVNFAVKKGSRTLATYLTKYVTKNDSEFDHLAWHNSRGFSCLFTAVTFTVAEFKKFQFGPFLNRIRVFDMNFAKFIPWLYGPPPLLLDHLYQLNSYIQTTANVRE